MSHEECSIVSNVSCKAINTFLFYLILLPGIKKKLKLKLKLLQIHLPLRCVGSVCVYHYGSVYGKVKHLQVDLFVLARFQEILHVQWAKFHVLSS